MLDLEGSWHFEKMIIEEAELSRNNNMEVVAIRKEIIFGSFQGDSISV